MYDSKLAFLLPAFLWLFCFLDVASAKPVIVSLLGRSVQLRGEVAEFGYHFDQLISHPANLMLASEEDPYLCSYPSSLVNASARESSSPIALFVSRGECSFEAKAEVALALQKNFIQDIQYVIIYNNDHSNPSQLIRMGAIDQQFPTLGFVAVSTRAGTYTMSSILYYAEAAQQDPHLSSNETDWQYPIAIEEFRSYARGGAGANTFYLLRFVLFSLLILAPFLRAAYLWWNGGGRIEFRRNDRGRITGLQYVRPIPYWFAPSAQGPDGRPRRTRLLTEEQVRDLPEITFVKSPDDDDSTDDTSLESGVVPVESTESDEAPEEPTIIVDNNDDEEKEKGQAGEEETNDEESPETSPVEVPPEGLPEDLTTSCTTCSICIDDFEDGERIRLLPKCRHAFHTDCLMPWLTERQGCCPLCKRSVLGPDDDSSDDEENRNTEEDVEQAQVEPLDAPGQAREEHAAPVDGQAQAAPVESEAQGPATRAEVRSGDPPV